MEIDTVHKTLGALENELERLKAATEHITASKEAAGEAATAASRVTESGRSLARATEALLERIEQVDFHQRFDAVGKGLAEINESLGKIKSQHNDTHEALERAQKKRRVLQELASKSERERDHYHQDVQSSLATHLKQQRFWFAALVLIGLLNAILLVAS